ncbi:MAG: hypothetical protein RIQ60_3473 [Pseudomonadota bacterium]|jgi:hypothetical protein
MSPAVLPSTSRARGSRHWLSGFALCFAAMLPPLWWSWRTPAPYGDLTRIGRFSEAAFGWQAEQPGVNPTHLRNTALAEADVVVIGDSFSVSLAWQTVLVAAGWRVATLHWHDVGPLCDDLPDSLARQGFRGRALILQRVERSLPGLLDDTRACGSAAVRRRLGAQAASRHAAPPTQPPSAAFDWHSRIDTGIVTAWHTWQAEQTATGYLVKDVEAVRVRPVPSGCQRFSHALCNKALFLADDEDLPPLSPEHLKRLAASVPHRTGLRTIWLVMPNKSTVYLQEERARSLSAALRADFTPEQAPDLFADFQRQRDHIRDLYAPNDTHLSTAGYLHLGQTLLDLLGAAPAR